MFRVSGQTATSVYHAQKPNLRGRLRLDLSSSRLPDLGRNLDVECAREAIGERVLRLLGSLASDAASEGHEARFPITDTTYEDRHHFTEPVIKGLVELLGLDRSGERFRLAMDLVLRDFLHWAGSADARQYGVTLADGDAYISCPKLPAPLLQLGEEVHRKSLDELQRFLDSPGSSV